MSWIGTISTVWTEKKTNECNSNATNLCLYSGQPIPSASSCSFIKSRICTFSHFDRWTDWFWFLIIPYRQSFGNLWFYFMIGFCWQITWLTVFYLSQGLFHAFHSWFILTIQGYHLFHANTQSIWQSKFSVIFVIPFELQWWNAGCQYDTDYINSNGIKCQNLNKILDKMVLPTDSFFMHPVTRILTKILYFRHVVNCRKANRFCDSVWDLLHKRKEMII